jgi:hypothetical protein
MSSHRDQPTGVAQADKEKAMTMVIVMTVAWFLGAGSYAVAQRVKQAYVRRGEPDPSMAFLLDEIKERVFPRTAPRVAEPAERA